MGKLFDLLRERTQNNSGKSHHKVNERKQLRESPGLDVGYASNSDTQLYSGGVFDLTPEELNIINSSVVELNTFGKTREQITIGMYGNIKNPKTGKRFVIPYVDFTSDNYVYQYAEMMRLLVSKPEEFKKIMNWE